MYLVFKELSLAIAGKERIILSKLNRTGFCY